MERIQENESSEMSAPAAPSNQNATGEKQEVLANNDQDSHAAEAAGSEESSEISHEVTIFAEPIFNIGGFQVTNSLINSWLVVVLVILLAVTIKKKITKIPRGVQNFFEYLVESGLNLCDNVTSDRKKSLKIFPIVFALFLFILLNNYLGLIPGVGSIGLVALEHGEKVFVPYFRGGTADLNTTLALALFAVIAANVFGVVMVGAWNYFNKFINLKALFEPIKEFGVKKEGSVLKRIINLFLGLFVGLIKFMVGVIEIVGEAAKVASLSFRLFGNIFAGEVLLTSIAVIFAFLTPIPFMFLELIVGVIQALVFSILTLVYFTIASQAEEH